MYNDVGVIFYFAGSLKLQHTKRSISIYKAKYNLWEIKSLRLNDLLKVLYIVILSQNMPNCYRLQTVTH